MASFFVCIFFDPSAYFVQRADPSISHWRGAVMTNTNIYKDISERTGGDIYIGIVGPVRTGKSTFIKRFMELLVLPNINDGHIKERCRDEMPQSASGKTIMTTEPKFIPKEAAEITLNQDICMKVRLIDCVGYMIDGVSGHIENGEERKVKTTVNETLRAIP